MLNEAILAMPSEQEQIQKLARLLQAEAPVFIAQNGEQFDCPPSLLRLLKDAVQRMSNDQAVALTAHHEQLTTQRAADLLGVSRPHLVKLLEAGALPYHKAGTHRRVYYSDLLAYSARRDQQHHSALNELARQAVDAGLYDNSGGPEDGRDE